MSLLIRGATLPDGGSGDVLMGAGRITAIGRDLASADARRVDADGLTVAPGFIDLQVNGAAGLDFTSEPSAMWRAGEELARHGVTSFLATIITGPRGTIDAALRTWRSAPDAVTGALPIGLHLEGPFLSPARAGAHPQGHLRAPDRDEAAGWSAAAGIRMVTLAPELPGALELASELVARGVVVAAGHSDATEAEARAGFDAGVRHVTHLWNAMPKKGPGLASAALADPRVTVGLIGDGLHVSREVLNQTWGAAPGRVTLVSDAMAGLGMPPGTHRLGEREVVISETGARLADGTVAGSVACLDVGLRCLIAATGAGVSEILPAMTSVPAQLLGLDDGHGALLVGGRADLVFLTPELEVAATLVGGEVAYAAEELGWR